MSKAGANLKSILVAMLCAKRSQEKHTRVREGLYCYEALESATAEREQ